MEGPEGKAKDNNDAQAKCTRKNPIKIDFIKMPDGIIHFSAPPISFTKPKSFINPKKPKTRVSPRTQKVEEMDDINKLMQKLHFSSSRHKAISSHRNAEKQPLKVTTKPKPLPFKDSSLCKFVAHRGFPRNAFTPTIRPLDYPARASGTSRTGKHQNICLMSGYNLKSFEEVRCEDYLAGWKGPVSTSHRGPKFKTTMDDLCVNQVITASPEYADCSLEELRMEYYMPSIAWKHRQSFSLSSTELKKLPVSIGSTVYVFMEEAASKRKGTIRYIGRLPKKPVKEIFAGIEFEENCGVCDGSHGGIRFFRTKDRCAEFIPIDSVLPGYMIKESKSEKDEPSTAHSDDGKGIRCSICLENPIKIIFLPCCHYVTCETCSKKVDNCPICRQKITTKRRVYVSGQSI